MDITTVSTYADAVTQAKAQGKLILTAFGRPACPNCQTMQARFKSEKPPLKQWISQTCILWTTDIDKSNEHLPYVVGFDKYSLPMMCIIDPNAKKGTWLARYNGIVPTPLFVGYIQKAVKAFNPTLASSVKI